ncbi:MAG: helix-turn-helix transcriptional regulator [Alphaproteobacteria bacterium]|nr:helix-turn-helix transcriptional regulator [Alphaproteobacteria bacterium]
MVKDARANQFESAPQSVIAVGNEYPAGYFHPPHRHQRAQLLYAEYGTMIVETEEGGWVVPPREGVWIPHGIQHSIRMQSNVATRSVYFDRETSERFPRHCQVIGVSPLLRQLLIAAVDLPVEYDRQSRAGRIMTLIVDETRDAPVLPLSTPFPSQDEPRQARLAAACRKFLESPSIRNSIDDWCADLAMSRRSFTRLFRRETGLSFSAWRRRACLQAALPRLVGGASITTVALDLGYSSPSAFTAMFTRHMGRSPQEFVRMSD